MKKIFNLLFALLLLPSIVFAQTVVSSKTKVISVAPTVSTSAYSTGNLIGPKQTLTGAGACDTTVGQTGLCGGIINSVTITDLEKQSADFDIIIFSSNPSATTFTDRAAFDIDDADLPKVACVISVTTDVLFNDNAVAVNQNAGCVFSAPATSGTLYAAVVIRSTATYSASGLTFRYGILQD